MQPLILASASPRRREILTTLGVDHRVIPADVDESVAEGTPPEALVREVATRKALALSRAAPDQWVLGADTVVSWDRHVLGKPTDPADAARMLRLLSGKWHEVWTGVCLARGGEVVGLDAECTRVQFRELSEPELLEYVASGDPLDKAGAYGIQTRGARLVRGIEGCYHNVVGLPIFVTLRLLEKIGTDHG